MNEVKPITVKKLPLILNRNIVIKKSMGRNIKLVKPPQSPVQEDIIYTSKLGDFTAGEVRNMTIVNRLNVLTKSSKTVANCQSHSGHIFEKTSEEITKLIGQDNYDILFSSLCSVINQELKIRSINALLTVPKQVRSVACQTDPNPLSSSVSRNVVDAACQPNEILPADHLQSLQELKKKTKPRRRNKRQQLAPYVVKDAPEERQPRRIVISPDKFESFAVNEEKVKKESPTATSLPELGSIFDEDSNNSVNSGRFSSISVMTTHALLVDPMSILTNVDKHTGDIRNNVNQHEVSEKKRYHDLDSSGDLRPSNEAFQFGKQDDVSRMPQEQRVKTLLRQGFTVLKDCLTMDSDGHLPIHVAVLSNDLDMLKRQCLVLKLRGASVDYPADGLTPLRMSLFQENTQITATLLHFGADPLDTDDDDKTVFHIASELASDHLQILINYCQQNARKILQDNEHDMWCPAYEKKSDEELAPILLTHINKLYDNQGYTPLMLASKLGKYNNVMALVESCRATVNLTMPNSGNTALYLAVGAACMDAAERGNKAKIVDHFSKTIEVLVENGADPGIDNFAGSSVNDLLTEFNIAELSMLIANKLTSVRYFDGQLPNGIKGSDFMLFKDDQGKVDLRKMKEKKMKKPVPLMPKVIKPPPPTKTKTTPIIIENIEYKPPVKVDNSLNTPSVSNSIPKPVNVGPANVENDQAKQELIQNKTPIVKNFRLNKPLLITSDVTNNKRKLDIVVDTSKSKKPNNND